MPEGGQGWTTLPEFADSPSCDSPLPCESPARRSRQRFAAVPAYGSRTRRISWRSIFDAKPTKFRSDDCGDAIENPPRDFLCLRGQPATLVVVETDSPIADLLSKDAIFLYQIRDYMLLMLVHPTGEGHDEKGKWIQSSLHRTENYRSFRRAAVQ